MIGELGCGSLCPLNFAAGQAPTPMDLTRDEVIAEQGQPLRHAHLPVTSILSNAGPHFGTRQARDVLLLFVP